MVVWGKSLSEARSARGSLEELTAETKLMTTAETFTQIRIKSTAVIHIGHMETTKVMDLFHDLFQALTWNPMRKCCGASCRGPHLNDVI